MNDTNYSFDISKVLIYLRKSRSDSPDMTVEEVLQKHESMLQEYFSTHFNAKIPESNIYREVVSGETIASRPVMKHIMKLIESDNYEAVAVVDPQRLSRGDLEDCGRLINTLRYTNTKVITLQQQYDLSNEFERKFFEMELSRGNDYLEYTKKILLRGRIASVKAGNYIGSIAPYGYKKIAVGTGKNTYHTLEIIPDEAEAVVLMHELYANTDMGFTKIANRLNELCIKPRKSNYWTAAMTKNIIGDKIYIGKLTWNDRKIEKHIENGVLVSSRPHSSDVQYYDGKHPHIITDELYQACLDRRGKHPRLKHNNELSNPFAGLLYCGTCGHAMSYKRYTNRSCGAVSESMLCNHQTYCHTKSVMYSAFTARFIDTLENVISDLSFAMKHEDTSSTRINESVIKNLEEQIKKLYEKDSRQKDAYEDGIYTKQEFIQRNLLLQEKIADVEARLDEARNTVTPIIDYQERISLYTDCISVLKNPDIDTSHKNALLRSCIRRINYYNDMESKPGIGRFVDNEFRLEIEFK